MSAEQRPLRKRSLVSRLFCCIAPQADDRPSSAQPTKKSEGPTVDTTSDGQSPVPREAMPAEEGIKTAPVTEKVVTSIPEESADDQIPTNEIQEVRIPQSNLPVLKAASPFLSGLQPALAHDGDAHANTIPTTTTESRTTTTEEKAALAQDAPLTPSSAAVTATVPLEILDNDVVQRAETPEVQDTAWLLPPLSRDLTGKKCLVLDLDETLVHSSFKVIHQADFVVPVEIDGIYHNVYVIKRPGVDDFMLEVGKHFEIVVFTASLAKYADPVLDILDVHKVVHHRLFRESCHNHMGNYVKDLSQLGRDLKDAIIIDNSPASYVFHPAHAVPISSWFNDVHDTELTDLIPFLVDLKSVDDVSQVLELSL